MPLPASPSRDPALAQTSLRSPGLGRCVAALLLWLALVDLGYWLAGLRLDVSDLPTHYQFLSLPLLQHDLLRSLYYLHSQPPLYNLFLGIVLKAAPEHYVAVFYAMHMVLGAVFELSVFWLLYRLGVGTVTAALTAGLFAASPTFALWQSVLFYTFMLATLVTFSGVCLVEFLRSRRAWAAAAFFITIFLICGIRALFHLGFFLLLAGALMIACRSEWRKILLCAAIPGLLLVAIYAKNYFVFGQFGVSSWFGFNTWAMTTRNIPMEERKALVRQGILSPISLVDREAKLKEFPPEYLDVSKFPNVPALVDPMKSTGAPNMNYAAFIAISKAYGKDTIAGFKQRPTSVLIGLARAYFCYLKSSVDHMNLGRNRRYTEPLLSALDYGVFGKIPFDFTSVKSSFVITHQEPQYVYVTLLLGLPGLVFYGLALLVRERSALRGSCSPPTGEDSAAKEAARAAGSTFTSAQYGLLLYMLFTILYVCLVGNTFENSENNRFRFNTEGFYIVLLGLFLHRVVLGWYRRRRGGANATCRPAAAGA
jgi:hypothetical protein